MPVPYVLVTTFMEQVVTVASTKVKFKCQYPVHNFMLTGVKFSVQFIAHCCTSPGKTFSATIRTDNILTFSVIPR